MICKKDVILWFKELESYKRIDTMCTLLNMCLPFELRFLGTCLEELGRRDSQELRGMELRVNNPQDLATDMVACQRGEPTDKKIRRKMALYLALIRACNRTCVTEIFRTLDGWGERDFLVMTDSETLQELLLVYTLAANHPVFSFEQQSRCAEIFDKIKENKLVSDHPPTVATVGAALTPHHIIEQHHQSTMTQPILQQQQVMSIHMPPPQPPPPSHQELLEQQQNALHAIHLTGHHHPQLLTQAPIQMLTQAGLNFSQAHLAKLMPTDGMQHPLGVDGMPHMLPSNMTIPADANALLAAHPNAAAAATWPLRHHFAAPPPLQQQQQQQQPQQTGPMEQHPPQTSSPMLSQQSSPSSSRATSPNRASNSAMTTSSSHQPSVRNLTQRMAGGTMKNMRRPSAEKTPPPISQQQQLPPHAQQLMANEMILPQNLKHMDDMVMNNETTGNQIQTLRNTMPPNLKHMDDIVMNNESAAGNQMLRNGLPRTGPHGRLKAGSFISAHQQQQQPPPNHSPVNQLYQAMPGGNYVPLPYSMQNMPISMADHQQHVIEGVGMGGGGSGSSGGGGMNSKSAGSDSGSSIGSGEISPPETPTLLTNSTSHHRLNSDQQQLQKHHQQQMNYNKQLSLLRLNGRTEKLVPVAVSAGSVSSAGTSLMYPPAGVVTNVHQSMHPQQQSQLFSTDINLMQATLAAAANSSNSNNSGANGNTNVNSTGAPNSQLASNAVLISSPTATAVSGAGGSGGGGAASTANLIANSVILQQQQQYNTNYPYHITTTTRPPPLMAHQPNMAPPPGTFRLQPAFSLPHNGEMIYSSYPASAITFLSSGVPPPPGTPAPVTLRSNAGAAVAVTVAANSSVVPVPPAAQPTPAHVQQQTTTTGGIMPPNAATAAMLSAAGAPPYSALTVGVLNMASNKPVSCYNCGSQTHSGRDCQEASMDDVTRGGIYKLDYSVSAAAANANITSPTTTAAVTAAGSSASNTGNTSKGISIGTTTAGGAGGPTQPEAVSHTHTKQHSNDASQPSSSSSSTSGGNNNNNNSTVTPNAINVLSNSTTANVLNTK